MQDIQTTSGATVSEELAIHVHEQAIKSTGNSGYSPIGAVVGATYPEDARKLRKIIPNSILLVPGYGTQGAGANDVVPNFNEDGLGAIVNASRSVNFAYLNEYDTDCSLEQFRSSTKKAVYQMQAEIYAALKSQCGQMKY